MNDKNLTFAFTVNQTPEEVFTAINNVCEWWTGEIEGNTGKLGDEFVYRYKDIHYSKMRITELIPNKKVVWVVLESSLSFVKDKNEWNDTKIIFEISKKGDGTEIHFTHLGLVPKCECFDRCFEGWNFYINDSLKSLITTGKGKTF